VLRTATAQKNVFGFGAKSCLARRSVVRGLPKKRHLRRRGILGSGKSTWVLHFLPGNYGRQTNFGLKEEHVVWQKAKGEKIRPQIQLIVRDPSNSLNPRWSVEEIMLAPLNLKGKLKREKDGEETKQRAVALMTQVGLSSTCQNRLHQS